MESIGDIWPLYRLRVRTGDIELRWPDDDQLAALAALTREPLHDPEQMPFSMPWTDAPAEERMRSTLQFHWRCRGEWSPAKWHLPLVASRGGEVVGTQGMMGNDFGITREVETGSWVGRRFQNQGLATQMRTAMLHLAFEGLGALRARSGAFTDNAASLRVSEKLGYRPDGTETHVRRGEPGIISRLVLTRERWAECSVSRPEAELEGVGGCLELFGIRDVPGAAPC